MDPLASDSTPAMKAIFEDLAANAERQVCAAVTK
jgi:hypothetical protein